MTRIIKFLIIIFSLLISCSYTKTFHYIDKPHQELTLRIIPIYIDIDFSEQDLIAINEAIQAWNHSLNGVIRLSITTTKFDMDPDEIRQAISQKGFIFINLPNWSPLINDAPNEITYGFVNKVGGFILHIIRTRINSDEVFGLTLHEIGHLLGAQHNENGHLMKKYFNKNEYLCIDKLAAEEVANYLNLSANKMNYCQIF